MASVTDITFIAAFRILRLEDNSGIEEAALIGGLVTIRLAREGLISSDCQFRNRGVRPLVQGLAYRLVHKPAHRMPDARWRACPHAVGPSGACSTRARRLQDRSRTQMPARRPTTRWRMQKQS